MRNKRFIPWLIRSTGTGFAAVLATICINFAPVSATTCSTVSACVFGANTRTVVGSGFGEAVGVFGSSLVSDGVDGATSFASTNSAAKSGVAGLDLSKTGTRNSGVYGYSSQGFGMQAKTNSGTAVLGVATSATGVGIHAQGNALALRADVQNGTGLVVEDTSDNNYTSNTGIAVSVLGDGITVGTDFGTSLSVFANPMSYGAQISSVGGDALDIFQEGPGIPLSIIPNGASPDEILVSGLFALDPLGNLTISGALTEGGTPMSVTRTLGGHALRTYAPREAESTIEDVGETTVTSGHAAVALDPAFASTIDPRLPYYVFLTAEGENRGLYVTSKTSRGFFIRETNGGSSTLNVQYRIVAKPYDASANPRLPAVNLATLPYANTYVAQHIVEMKKHAARSRNTLTHVRKESALDKSPR